MIRTNGSGSIGLSEAVRAEAEGVTEVDRLGSLLPSSTSEHDGEGDIELVCFFLIRRSFLILFEAVHGGPTSSQFRFVRRMFRVQHTFPGSLLWQLLPPHWPQVRVQQKRLWGTPVSQYGSGGVDACLRVLDRCDDVRARVANVVNVVNTARKMIGFIFGYQV